MKKLKYIVIALLGLGACGCGNDFLDISPTTSLGEFEAIEDEKDLDYAVNGAYTYIEHYRGSTMWDGDALGDDMQNAPAKYEMNRSYMYQNHNLSTPTGRWNNLYSAGFHINSVLEKAKTIKHPTNPTRYKEMIAELRFLRVIIHWDAELRFGPLPSTLGKGKIKADALGVMICDEVPDNVRKDFYRDKVTDVWKFMVTEMEAIKNDLSREKREAYLNYWAAQAFLGRIYLYLGEWDKAFACAEDVIKNSPYTLIARKDYVASWGQAYASESIFEMPTTDNDNNGWYSLSYFSSPTGGKAIVATKDFMDLRAAASEDVRFDVFEETVISGKTYYFPSKKYPGRDGNIKVCNPKILRLSEVYLIAAEAAMKGTKGAVIGGKYLSDLREKRTTAQPRKYDNGCTLDDVLYERRLELWGEGQRAWDLWRNLRSVVRFTTLEEKEIKGHTCPNEAGVIAYDDYRTIWPIAQDQLDMMKPEDRITQQNPGY